MANGYLEFLCGGRYPEAGELKEPLNPGKDQIRKKDGAVRFCVYSGIPGDKVQSPKGGGDHHCLLNCPAVKLRKIVQAGRKMKRCFGRGGDYKTYPVVTCHAIHKGE